MSGKNTIFEDKKIKKWFLQKQKTITTIDDIDVDKTLVSKKNHMEQ